MGDTTAISWCDATFNPWWGCTKVGPGCDHCYAERFDHRVGGDHWGAGKPRRLVKDWSKPRKWNREAERTGVRPWVFCASMADVFDNEVPAEWRERLWQLMRETPNLNWIIVTKRIGNAAKMLPPDWPFKHVGLCITVCNQEEADRDVPKLLATPAAWRGISAEPLLGPIDFRGIWSHCPTHDFHSGFCIGACPDRRRINWVIVGGESGPHARPMHPRWATDIRDQCAAAGVSFHYKQAGEWLALPMASFAGPGWSFTREKDGKRYGRITSGGFEGEKPEFGGAEFETRYPWHQEEGCHYLSNPCMVRVGKERAGRLLDGKEHNGMPPLIARDAGLREAGR